MVQRDDGKCTSLKSTKCRSGLHSQPEWSLMMETRLIILHEDLRVLRLVPGIPVSSWMFSEPDLSQIISLFHLSLGI